MLPTNNGGKPPVNPFMYYSAFKLAIYFDNNKDKCRPLHSVETRATLPQIHYRKIKEIILDRRAGFAWCIDTVDRMKNKIHYAALYSAYDDTLFAKFRNGKWLIVNEPQFTEENRLIISRQFTIRNGFVVMNDVEANSLAIINK